MGLRRHCSLFLVLAGVFILAAKVAQGVTLEIAVRPSFGGEPLLLDSLRYKNAAGETLSISRLSYLLGGFALEQPGGDWVELPGQYAWMDAAQRRAFIRIDRVPAGRYRSLTAC